MLSIGCVCHCVCVHAVLVFVCACACVVACVALYSPHLYFEPDYKVPGYHLIYLMECVLYV